MAIDPISEALRVHYAEKFRIHGATSQGVDWGADTSRMLLRYRKMLQLLDSPAVKKPSVLDVGCGFGGLYDYAASLGLEIDYTGIDVAANMIEWASQHVAGGRFLQGSVLSHEFSGRFDYVICNGILTQKLDAPGLEMDQFASALIRRMFALAERGVAFNVMTTKVNHFAPNLYYRNPAELLAWCLTEITPHVALDHSYPLYEFTVYLHRAPVSPR
jgi:SAM-dependent methyltransferase